MTGALFLAYCPQCRVCYSVQPTGGPEIEGDSFPCITALCRGRLKRYRYEPDNCEIENILQVCRITVPIDQERFYKATMGLDQKDLTPERLNRAARGKQVVEMVLRPDDRTTRILIDQIVLQDGTRLHLASSVKGACVYRIEEP